MVTGLILELIYESHHASEAITAHHAQRTQEFRLLEAVLLMTIEMDVRQLVACNDTNKTKLDTAGRDMSREVHQGKGTVRRTFPGADEALKPWGVAGGLVLEERR